jgi:hypothetical protein
VIRAKRRLKEQAEAFVLVDNKLALPLDSAVGAAVRWLDSKEIVKSWLALTKNNTQVLSSLKPHTLVA